MALGIAGALRIWGFRLRRLRGFAYNQVGEPSRIGATCGYGRRRRKCKLETVPQPGLTEYLGKQISGR